MAIRRAVQRQSDSDPSYSFAGGAPPRGALPPAALRSASCLWTAGLGPFRLALCDISSPGPFSFEQRREKSRDSHDSPAHHADDNHKGPARNHADTKKGVSHRLVHAQFRQLPVKGIEPALVQDALFVLLPTVYGDHVPDGRMGHVEVIDVDRAGGGRLVRLRDGTLDVPEGGRLGHPSGAEDALLIAIDVGQVRRRRVRSQHAGRLVPFPLESVADAAAGLVAAGDEDHPFLWRFRGVWIGGKLGLVVIHCQGGDL